jgi:hypothetical protein
MGDNELLRDIILAALSEPVASVPQDVEEFIAAKQRSVEWIKTYAAKYNLKQMIHVSDLRAWMAESVYTIPDTHRVVPVELLEKVLFRGWRLPVHLEDAVQAIIDKEQS